MFPESEFAYRRQRSTEDAVVLAINRWLIAKAECKYTGDVMVETSKAFDRVQHARLVPVLFSFGLRGSALSWFSHYPSYRWQCVRIGNNVSVSTICSKHVVMKRCQTSCISDYIIDLLPWHGIVLPPRQRNWQLSFLAFQFDSVCPVQHSAFICI